MTFFSSKNFLSCIKEDLSRTSRAQEYIAVVTLLKVIIKAVMSL